jgi:spoIIIJ-associated protein
MLNRTIFEGKTKEEAIENAQLQCNASKEDIIIMNEEVKSALFKGKKYIIEIITKQEVIKYVKEMLKEIAKYFNTEINIEVKEVDNIININIIADNNSLLIGKNGKNLESIQNYLRNVINEQTNNALKLNLDVSNYKKKKIDNLERQVKRIAKEVKNTKVEAKLDPMNSYERMIVHNAVAKFEELTTQSYGEEPERYVVIKYKEN